MGVNNFVADATVNAALYSEKVWREKLPSAFWARMFDFPMPGQAGFSDAQYLTDVKTGAITGYQNKEGGPIRIVRDLVSGFGDTIRFPHVLALRGEGITGTSGQTLEGNEEEMSVGNYSITLEEYAHAVADKSPLGRKRTQFDILKEMGNQIMTWGVTKTDKLIWDALYGGTPTTIIYPDGVAATTGILNDTAHRVTMKMLRQAKAIAETETVGSRFIIEPLVMNGKNCYIVVLPPDAELDLKEDSEFKQSLQQAGNKGMDNPIFAGADYITVDGLVIYSHQKAKTVTNWGAGANVAGARIKLLGANALCYAMGAAPSLIEQDGDYKRKKGIAFQMFMKASRPVFENLDYGSLELRVNCQRTTF